MRVAEVSDAAQPGEVLEKALSRHLILQGELPWQIADPGPYLHAVFPDIQAELTWQIADPSPYLHAIIPGTQAEVLATPTGRPQEPQQGPYVRGLAGPVGPEETEDLSFLDGEIHNLNAPRSAAVGLGKLL